MNNPGWTRRRALATLGSLPSAMLVPSLPAWARKPSDGPPVARLEPVSETLWGETIVDPYRWMENAKDRDWEPFMKGWAAHTRGVLDAIPGRKALAERIGKLSGDLPIANAPLSAGGRLFYEMRPAGANQPRNSSSRLVESEISKHSCGFPADFVNCGAVRNG